MKSATRIVWEAAGSQEMPDCVPRSGRCWLCGGDVERGSQVKRWLPSGFTDHARVATPTSDIVCEACVFITSRVSPVPGRPPGKCSACDGTLVIVTPRKGERAGDPCVKCNGTGLNENGGNYRNYSHIFEEGAGYSNFSKGEKPAIRAFIEREKRGAWFCCVADSGQKHVLPFARMNGPGVAGVVLLDELLVQVPRDTSVIAAMVDLLTDGVTKDEVLSGSYTSFTMMDRRDPVQRFESAHGRLRGSPWFALAVWLAQRDEEKYERRRAAKKETKGARKPKAKAGNCGARDGTSDTVSVRVEPRRPSPDDVLGSDPKPSQVGGDANGERKRVGERHAAQPSDPRAGQLRIPGID